MKLAKTSFELLHQIDRARLNVDRHRRELDRIIEISRQTNYGCGSCDKAYAQRDLQASKDTLAELERQFDERTAA